MNKNDIIGAYVLHNKNGISSIGKVNCITQENGSEYLKVQFENIEKTFPFPDIVAPKYNFNFIFLDKDIQKYVENLFTEKYSVSAQETEKPKIFNNKTDDKLEQIIDIFDEIHTDFSTVIDLLFDKIIKERSISFLYEKKTPVYEKEIPAPPIPQNVYTPKCYNYNATNHNFNFDGGEILSNMGATWFVSYSYYLCIDENHYNWNKTNSLNTRIHNYNKSKKYHDYWLEQVLKMSDAKLNTNKLNLKAHEIKEMARKILKQQKEKNL